jgi:hypothetical protein
MLLDEEIVNPFKSESGSAWLLVSRNCSSKCDHRLFSVTLDLGTWLIALLWKKLAYHSNAILQNYVLTQIVCEIARGIIAEAVAPIVGIAVVNVAALIGAAAEVCA